MNAEDLKAVLEFTDQLRDGRERAEVEIDAAREETNAIRKELLEARERIRQLTDLWHTWEKRAEENAQQAIKNLALATHRYTPEDVRSVQPGQMICRMCGGQYAEGGHCSTPMCNPQEPNPVPVQPGQLRRFLVEVAPQKDEKHVLHCRVIHIGDGVELRVSLHDYKKPWAAAMSVQELPEMPGIGELQGEYMRAAETHPYGPEKVLRGIRAVLRACGLEVEP